MAKVGFFIPDERKFGILSEIFGELFVRTNFGLLEEVIKVENWDIDFLLGWVLGNLRGKGNF